MLRGNIVVSALTKNFQEENMKRRFKTASALVLSIAAVISATACNQTPNQPEVTTNPDFAPLEEYISTITDSYKSKLAGGPNADIKVEKKIKWLSHWAIDETQAAAVLFKQVYGIPEMGNNDYGQFSNSIFDWKNVNYADRYTQLAKDVTNGDSPDIFQFEITNFPYTACKGLFQPIDDYIDFSNPMWDSNRETMEQFKWDNKSYCAITALNLDQVLFYRRSVVSEAGLTDPYELVKAGNWNWNTFLEMCSQFSDPEAGKYCIDGHYIPDKFVCTTGVPLVEIKDGKLVNNFYNSDIERCMTTVIDTMTKENYRYPRHELNGWSVNESAWAKGDILFLGGLEYDIKDKFQGYFKRFKWEDGDLFCVPVPKDPNTEKYYQTMKNDSYMLCGGAKNTAGFAAWNLCCMATAYDKEAAKVGRLQLQTNYVGFSDEIMDWFDELKYSGMLTPVFDFKDGIGQDIADGNNAKNPVDGILNIPFLDGLDNEGNPATFTTIRAANEGIVNSRIEDINNGKL